MQPTQLGPYKIRSRLGRGGMGAVYEAEEGAGGRLVAVKTLAAHFGDDAGLRRRFEGEIETLKALRHPGIVQLLAFGEEDGIPYFAMELVPGKSLDQELRAGRLFTWRETVALAIEVVRALKSAHDHGVVHRDLKPANLLLLDQPVDGTTVKLADFGIARLFGDASQTLAGTVVGTAEFMAPEQAAGKQVDHRADLYALGLVMYAMLTGRPPFHGGDVSHLLDRQRREEPPRIATRVPDVPPELDQLVARLLAKDPAHRPANALAVGRSLAAIAGLPDTSPGTAARPTGAGATAAGTTADRPRPPTAASSSPAAVDQFAATQAMPAAATPPPAADAAATAASATRAHTHNASPSAFAGAPTVPAAEPGAATPPAANRFTTVEELHRTTRLRAEAEQRRQRLWQAVATVFTVAAAGAAVYLLVRQRTADELHGRIAAVAADESADLRDVRPLIDQFLARHPQDPRAAAVRGLALRLDVDALERRTRRRQLTDKPLPPIERDYRAAMAREPESPAGCVAALEAILAVTPADTAAADGGREPTEVWLGLVRRQIDRLAPLAAKEREQDDARARAVLAEAADLAAAAAKTGDAAQAAALAARRKTLLESLVELNAARPHMAAVVEEARRLLAAGPASATTPPPERRP
jgi:serine/threonine-protein kinase